MTDKAKIEQLQAYWRIAEQVRGRIGKDLPSIVLWEAKSEGLIPPSWEVLDQLVKRRWEQFSSLPVYASDFLVAYLKGKNVDRVIDPSAGHGQLIGPLLEKGIGRRATAWESNKEAVATGTVMTQGLPVEWQHADFLKVEESGPSDLVVSAPIIRVRTETHLFKSADGEDVEVQDNESHLIVLKACMSLSEKGECLVFLPQSFAFGRPKSVWSSLEPLGFVVESVVAMPDGFLAPWTRVSLSLFIIRRGTTQKRFIGKLVAPDQIELVAENLRKRQKGRAPEHGRLVSPDDFSSWERLEYVERLNRLRPKGNLAEVSVSDVATEINLARRDQDEPFTEQPNNMFIPLIGKQPAVTSSEDLRIKPHNYAQVVFNPDKAYAEYVAGYFNSDYGYLVRENALSGMTIPKINKQTLARASVLLPPIEQQTAMVSTHNAIRSLMYELRDKEKSLWSHPARTEEISQFVQQFTADQPLEILFEPWIDTLPFPLGSILWRYHADSDPRYKADHLLHFFEATAEFVTCILLSGFRSDAEFFHKNKARWLGGDEGSKLERSTFGYWVIVGERVGKDLRRLLSGKEEDAIRALTAFRTRDRQLLEALSSKDLFRVLKTARDYRNFWVAHGGIHGEEKYQKLLTNLEGLLTDMRGVIAQTFDAWLLMRPGAAKFKSGVYDYKVRALKGSRSIFRQENIKTIEPLDEGRMYLMHTGSNRPIELLPFLRMHRGPKSAEDACYFYNRVDGKAIRWLSYHFEQEDEVLDEDPDVLKVLAALRETGEINDDQKI